jgi:AcrR family transcriptional regulator
MPLMQSASPGKRPYAPRLPPEQRREELLEAAQAIALERGFHAVSIAGVAKACGVTRPVVYGTFADRTALLTALLDRAEQRVLAGLEGVFPDVPGPEHDEDPDALLLAGVTAYLTAVQRDPDTWRVILVPPEGAPAELSERVHAQRRVLLRTLRGLLDWGPQRRGGPAVDAELFARAVFILAEGAARLLLEDPERWRVEQFTDFTRTALAALRPQP